MKTCTEPLNRSILIRIIVFMILLGVILSAVQHYRYRQILYRENEHYIENILRHAEGMIDADDLSMCIETGIRSEDFQALQKELDLIRDTTDIRYIYIVVPLNTNEENNMKNVLAGVSREEYEASPDGLVHLNELSKTAYSPETAGKYLKAYESGTLTFFEETSEKGDEYTGLLPLSDSEGKPVAALCADMEMKPINDVLFQNTLYIALVIAVSGGLFAALLYGWLNRMVTEPIEQLEKSVTAFAMGCRNPQGEDLPEMNLPKIETDNEICSLSVATGQMAQAIRDYVSSILAAESELARMVVLANKDALTNVRNKNAYDAYEPELETRLKNGDAKFAILMADINYLKRTNDTLGHGKGDLYLQNCTKTLCDIFTHSPVFRVGGDEFLVVLSGQDYENREALVKTAREIFAGLSQNAALEAWERCSAAIGMAEPSGALNESVQEVVRRADEDMYREKSKMKITR